jgi:hypothetical protein
VAYVLANTVNFLVLLAMHDGGGDDDDDDDDVLKDLPTLMYT